MASKPKAKRRGRPPLLKGDRREIYAIRLPPELVERAKGLAVDRRLTTAVEDALRLWVDRAEYRARLSDNQGAKHG